MKKRMTLMIMCLCLSLCVGCGADKEKKPDVNGQSGTVNEGVVDDMSGTDEEPSAEVTLTCRVVHEKDGSLLLAEYEGGPGAVYRIGTASVPIVEESGRAIESDEIEEGSLIEIYYSGEIMESYPATPAGITQIVVLDYGFDNMCEMYLDVLEDLWETDEGLNSDIEMVGVDLSKTRLPEAERAAVAWRFSEEHGMMLLEASYEELVADGVIDSENLYWENGCLFTITEKAMEGTYNLNTVTFDAQKWRSGLGAYYFMDCTSIQTGLGEWCEYQVGAEAIS